MKTFNEHDSVIYTDEEGRRIDTFVVFSTDVKTGLTHINHENLKVPVDRLVIHPITIEKFHLPMHDAFSFELFKKLKEKYVEKDMNKAVQRHLKVEPIEGFVLAKAS
jgi:hypothetical protein